MHDALALGYDGFVLSDETAIGRHPLDACQAATMFLMMPADCMETKNTPYYGMFSLCAPRGFEPRS